MNHVIKWIEIKDALNTIERVFNQLLCDHLNQTDSHIEETVWEIGSK